MLMFVHPYGESYHVKSWTSCYFQLRFFRIFKKSVFFRHLSLQITSLKLSRQISVFRHLSQPHEIHDVHNTEISRSSKHHWLDVLCVLSVFFKFLFSRLMEMHNFYTTRSYATRSWTLRNIVLHSACFSNSILAWN